MEVGRTYATIQTDDESSIKALIRCVIEEIQGLSLRTAPPGSSESQGSIER